MILRHTLSPLVFLLSLLLFKAALGSEAPEQPSNTIRVVRVADAINPVVADFLIAELQAANSTGNLAFMIELDTPGGLDTSMRAIIQAIFASGVPVIVYVYPSGARAASAGALIALAADFIVMAPGTNIGAAHPVAIGPGSDDEKKRGAVMTAKVLNDAVAYARSIAQQRGRSADWAERIVRESVSTAASEALELKVIDLIAADEAALLHGLHGRSYLRGGETRILITEGTELVRAEMSWRQRILTVLSNPNVAYLLLMLGILGIFFEISQPGVILPGAIGAIALLMAFYAFQTLPVNYAGVLLILLAIVLFVLEIKVVSYGMLTVGGVVSLALGSLMLIESSVPYLQISRAIIFATVSVCAVFFSVVLWFVVRTHHTRFVSGAEGMIGEQGIADSEIHFQGRVFVHGEYWDAFSDEPIARGERIQVVRMRDGLRLEVRRAEEKKS